MDRRGLGQPPLCLSRHGVLSSLSVSGVFPPRQSASGRTAQRVELFLFPSSVHGHLGGRTVVVL